MWMSIKIWKLSFSILSLIWVSLQLTFAVVQLRLELACVGLESITLRRINCWISSYSHQYDSLYNKLAKLRRHASRVHFAKCTLDLYTLDINTLEKYTLKKHFGKMNKKSAKVQINGYCFFQFFWFEQPILRYLENSVWGPVEWVWDQLTGWGKSCQKQNLKINGPSFF